MNFSTMMNVPTRLFVLLLALFGVTSTLAAKQLYTCGMHPQVIRDEPGDCPICGMKLQPVRATAPAAAVPAGERKIKAYRSTMMPGEISPKPAKDSMGMDMVPVYEDASPAGAAIQIDRATVQRMNLRTASVAHGPVRREFRTVGSIAFNEAGLRDITTKYEGWLEQVFVNTTWSRVKAGEPLFEIYSPDLYNAQLNYLVALQAEPGADGPLARAALARLQLFDVPESFIAELKQTKQAKRTLVFRAPSDGTVIEKMGIAGQMMKPGERIYRLADLTSVWVQAEIYEQDLPFVSAGQPAIIRATYGPDRLFEGTVQELLPQVQEQTRTAVARIVLQNPDGFLRPGMFVDVRFAAQVADDAVLVPEMAVLRSGERNTVFVARDDGTFEPREVKLGVRSAGDLYQVLSGLHAGERVVTSGQFMLDSESQLREAIQKMIQPPAEAASGPAASAAVEPPAAATPPAPTHAAAAPAGSDAATDALAKLAAEAADAAAPLAADNLAGYNDRVAALSAALAACASASPHAAHGPLAAYLGGLKPAESLKAARRAFSPLSTAVADLALEQGITRSAGLHAFNCSMANAHWLQRDTETRNPFYGASMLTCGEELPPPPVVPNAPTAHAAPIPTKPMPGLPPGHPPIDAVTMASFERSQTGTSHATAAAPAEACGSCGMSAAAMAAGEPCEHDHTK
jgi:multidrug efflux pump subunit AcrA (membrane-fusion protein)